MSGPSLKTAEDAIAFMEGYLSSDHDLDAAIREAKKEAGLLFSFDSVLDMVRPCFKSWDLNHGRASAYSLAGMINDKADALVAKARRGEDATSLAIAIAAATMLWVINHGNTRGA